MTQRSTPSEPRSGGDHVPPQAEFRASWDRFGELLSHAIGKPGAQAIPEVFDILILLSEAVVALSRDVDRATYNDRADRP